MTIAPEARTGTPETAEPALPAVVRRRLDPVDRRLDPYAWLAMGVVGLIAALLRFVNLGSPKGKIFDEIYYATDAHNLWRLGYEWDEKNNSPGYVVHPPLGKWLIGIGEQIFGYNEVGWRFSAAVIGTASVVMLMLIAKHLFGSTALACAAGLLMTFDGAEFVLSRAALLDIFLMFFILAAFGCLVLDRTARRRRWMRFIAEGGDPAGRGRASRPRFAVPWWRLAAAVMMACALSVKWSALAFLPVMALLVIWWEVGARRSAGVRHPIADALLDESGWFLVCIAIIVPLYIASWSGWLLTDGGFDRHGPAGEGLPWGISALANLWDYHSQAYHFHVGLHDPHTYQSWPWQWLLLARPVAFYWSTNDPCGSGSCAAEVVLNGTPLLWWAFIPALAALIWFGIARRDWRAGALLAFIAAAWLPWFPYELDHRTMFFFYALPMEPFLILGIVYIMGVIMAPVGDPVRDEKRRMSGAVVAGVFIMLVALNFAYFYPIFTGQSIPYEAWMHRMWLGNRWI
ncbi:dolichyl-phosphate-mannose--protein mannosyltransferase [Hamadaea tsunoensis]|uniref:dolichyl-phosphate-mannose--protein mannosyltransferase n=1 Tax=Hamadaea tsunoensis TaxID=53368 RepID=UPI0004849350|nr:phospholipid carrier-dependent glycosyltransferase [Hamadaea tsunoensis]